MTTIGSILTNENARISIFATDASDVPDDAGVTVDRVRIYKNDTLSSAIAYTTSTPATGRTDIVAATSGLVAEGDRIEVQASLSYDGIEYEVTSRWQVRAVERGTDSAATPANVTDARNAIVTQGDSAWATATGFSTPTNVTDAQTVILAKLPAALVGGRIDAHVGALATDAITADSLAPSATEEVANAVAAVSTVVIPTIIAEDIVANAVTTRYRGTQWTLTVNDIGDEPTKIYCTVKSRDEADSEAVLQIVLNIPGDPGDGLLTLKGAPASDATWGSIAVSTYVEDDTTKRRAIATIKALATKDIAPGSYKLDFKSTGTPEVLGSGPLKVLADVTRATS